MPESVPHVVRFDTAEAAALMVAIKAWVGVLKIQTGGRLLQYEAQRAVNVAATLSSRMLLHAEGLCDCAMATIEACRVCGETKHLLMPGDGQRWRDAFRDELERNGNCWHCGMTPGQCHCEPYRDRTGGLAVPS